MATRVSGSKTVADSAAYLLTNRAALRKYEDVESLVLAEDPGDANLRHGAEFHLMKARSALARQLWSRQLFIGVTVLDNLLFHSFVHHDTDRPIERVIDLIRDHGLHHPGLVIFPVHSFGLLGAGLLHWRTDARLDFTASRFGLSLSPQTNSLKETLRYLDRARSALQVRRTIPIDLIEHWHRSRATQWLTHNPLLVATVQSFPGAYYENQHLILTRLQAACALLSMLAALQPPPSTTGASLFSSSQLNNFQTLDIQHYIVLYAHPNNRRVLNGDCVPMNVNPVALAELSDLEIDLDPTYWSRPRPESERIFSAIVAVHRGYLRHSFGAERNTASGRVFRKLFQSLSFFRRSFHAADGHHWSGVVALAVAFEMMLTDHYAPGVSARIVRRARLLLAHEPDSASLVSAVDVLYDARSKIVHAGATDLATDLSQARKAFALAFARISERLHGARINSASPMQALCGDPLS